MEQNIWKEKYPKMPESFHLALKDVVEENCGKESEPEKEVIMETPLVIPRKRNWKKLYTLGLAAVLTVGITVAGVAAAKMLKEESFDLAKYLGYESREGIEGLFQTEIEVTIPDEASVPLIINSYETEQEKEQYLHWWESNQNVREDNTPLLEIKEIMYDGIELAIYATATEAGKKYTLGADTINIGNRRHYLGQGEQAGESGDYVFLADQGSVELEPPFEVTLPLCVYKKGTRYENQDYIFVVDTEAEVIELPDREIEMGNCTMKITDFKKTRTAIWGKVEVVMTEEQKKAYEDSDRKLFGVMFKSDDGTVWESRYLSETEEENYIYDPNTTEWWFYERMPVPNCESTTMYILSCEKSSRDEKIDILDLENIWGEGIKISLLEK